jgi:hypothetical protein|tara:strand:- start:3155 stop:3505 length:351 start_codon:yes stop_codon:yes gene_type:complete
MAYQVKYKLTSFMLPDKDDWASVAEFKEYHDNDGGVARRAGSAAEKHDFKDEITNGQAKYKSADTVFSLESGAVFMTCTYNSESDYISSTADYKTARAAAGIDRRTKSEVVSETEV